MAEIRRENHLGCIKTLEIMGYPDNLPTSTGERRISEPSTRMELEFLDQQKFFQNPPG